MATKLTKKESIAKGNLIRDQMMMELDKYDAYISRVATAEKSRRAVLVVRRYFENSASPEWWIALHGNMKSVAALLIAVKNGKFRWPIATPDGWV